MNANEDGVGIGIGDCDPGWKRDKNVAIARHDNTVARFLEQRFQPLRNIQCHHFFRYALTGNAPAIIATMTGVNYDGGKPGQLRLESRSARA